MILSKIKVGIGIAVTAIIGVLYALLKIEKSEKKAEETKAKAYKDTAAENAKVIEEVKREQKIKDDVSKLSNDDVRSRLLKSARDRGQV